MNARWTIEYKQGRTGGPYALIKGSVSGTNVQIVVSDGKGYQFKNWTPDGTKWGHFKTKGMNVQMSMNATAELDWYDFDKMNELIAEAREHLNA